MRKRNVRGYLQSGHSPRECEKVRRRKAIIRFTNGYITVLCNIGHLLESHKLDENFGGSVIEADLAFGEMQLRGNRLAEKCQGYGHSQECD